MLELIIILALQVGQLRAPKRLIMTVDHSLDEVCPLPVRSGVDIFQFARQWIKCHRLFFFILHRTFLFLGEYGGLWQRFHPHDIVVGVGSWAPDGELHGAA